MKKVNPDQLEQVSGGFVVSVEGKNEYWVVKQDGEKLVPAPTLEEAQKYAKQYNISSTVLTDKEYKEHYGRDLA